MRAILMRVIACLLSASLVFSPALGDSSYTAPTATGQAATGQIPGSTTNDTASDGNVGQLISAVATGGSATVTITIAAPGVVTWTSHGLALGSPFYATTTGALPTGLTASTVYWVIPVDANSFRLATSPANAIAGTAITTTGSQSGTHTGNSSVPLTLNTPANVAFVNLTAGSWDVDATGVFIPTTTTHVNNAQVSTSQTSATLETAVYRRSLVVFDRSASEIPFTHFTGRPFPLRLYLPATTPVYLVLQGDFDTSTLAGYGIIRATRPR